MSKLFKTNIRFFNIEGMVIGHTPQHFLHKEGSNDTCIEKDRKHLFRIDNGSSKAFNKFDVLSPEVSEERKIQVLKITYKNGKSTSEIIRED